MVRDEYLHDVARLLELPPRALELLKEIIAIGDETVVLDAPAKVLICEKMGLYQVYKNSAFPNTNLVNQFLGVLSKKGAITKEKRSTYRLSPLFRNIPQDIQLVITYSDSGREMKLNIPEYGEPDSTSSTADRSDYPRD